MNAGETVSLVVPHDAGVALWTTPVRGEDFRGSSSTIAEPAEGEETILDPNPGSLWDDERFLSTTKGVVWLIEEDPELASDVATIVDSNSVFRRSALQISTDYIDNDEDAYIALLSIQTDRIDLALAATVDDAMSGSEEGPSFTTGALADLGLAIQDGTTTRKWRLSDFTTTEPYNVTITLTQDEVDAIGNAENLRVMIVDISDVNIDWDNFAFTGPYDRNADVEVTTDALGGEIHVDAENTSGTRLYLSLLQLKGRALTDVNSYFIEEKDEDSIADYGLRSNPAPETWYSDYGEARDFAREYLRTLKDPSKRIHVKVNTNNKRAKELFELDVSDVVNINWLGESVNMFVESVENVLLRGGQHDIKFMMSTTENFGTALVFDDADNGILGTNTFGR